MGLGDRGKRRIRVNDTPTADALFAPTETLTAASNEEERRVGRPKGSPTKAKTFTLPLELNQRLRRFAFERECKEVDVVRAALEAYLDANEK